MSESLYDIATLYRDILGAECESPEELAARNTALDEVSDSFEAKAENVIRYIRNLEANAEAIGSEIDRLGAKMKSARRSAESLKSYLAAMLHLTGRREMKAGIFSAKFKNNPPSISVVDESKLDEKYFRITKTVSITAIKDALKAGEIIDGIEKIQGERLEIR